MDTFRSFFLSGIIQILISLAYITFTRRAFLLHKWSKTLKNLNMQINSGDPAICVDFFFFFDTVKNSFVDNCIG